MGMAQLQAEHWATQAGFGLAVGSRKKHSGHWSASCQPTQGHWAAAGEVKGGSFEGSQFHWEDSLVVVDTGLAVQMPSSCPVVVVAVAVAAAAAAVGGIDAEKDRVSRHVDRNWHTGAEE